MKTRIEQQLYYFTYVLQNKRDKIRVVFWSCAGGLPFPYFFIHAVLPI